MRSMAMIAVAAIIGSFYLVWPVRADNLEEQSRTVLNGWLEEVMRSASIKIIPKVIPIQDQLLDTMFPENRFFGVYISRWPVAITPPKELSNETVVRVQDAGSVEPIRDEAALKSFLEQALTDVGDETRARSAIVASLELAEAGAKGGPYQFDSPEVSLIRQADSLVASARAQVQQPARGELAVSMLFGPQGKVEPGSVRVENRVRPGPPPAGVSRIGG
jgi:hypothetical protein